MSIQERMAELNNLLQSYIFYAILPNNLQKKRYLISHFNISRPCHFPYPTRCGRVRNDTCQSKKAERIDSMIKPMAWNDFDTFSPKYLEVSNNLPIFAAWKVEPSRATMCGTVAWLQQCRDDEQFDLAAWFHKHSDHHSYEWWPFFIILFYI